MCRTVLKNEDKRCFFKAITGTICYNYRSLQNVEVYEANQSKGGTRKRKGRISHVLVAQKGLKKLHLNKNGLTIEGFGQIYQYTRRDGSKDYSIKVSSAKLVN